MYLKKLEQDRKREKEMSAINDKIHQIYNKMILIKYSKKNLKKYMASSDNIKNRETKIEREDYLLAVNAHTIEKGLGCKNIKPGFGVDKVNRILEMMNSYLEKGYPEDKFGFLEVCAVVKEYIAYKKSVNENVDDFEKRYEEILGKCKLSKEELWSYRAGKNICSKEQLECKEPEKIEQFIKNCHSVRNYKDEPVKEEDIQKALALAKYAPSACNRQPVKCYYTMDKEKIKKVDSIIPGNVPIRGTTPNYIVVTVKMTHFGRDEYNQWYVNGGIYLAYLRETLCVYNVGNCIYQWAVTADEDTMRQIFNIPDSEVIIGVVGIGYYDEESHLIAAQRK